MKPKLNIIQKQIDCEIQVFEEIPHFKICNYSHDTQLFDATEFCKGENVNEVDYSLFYSSCHRDIDNKIKDDGLKLPQIFYKNADGHTLIHSSISIIYMQFASPELSAYFNNIVASCLINGMAFSDLFVANLAMSRLSDETINQLMKEREENDKNTE